LEGVTISCYEGDLREVVLNKSVVNELYEGYTEGPSYSIAQIEPVAV